MIWAAPWPAPSSLSSGPAGSADRLEIATREVTAVSSARIITQWLTSCTNVSHITFCRRCSLGEVYLEYHQSGADDGTMEDGFLDCGDGVHVRVCSGRSGEGSPDNSRGWPRSTHVTRPPFRPPVKCTAVAVSQRGCNFAQLGASTKCLD